MFKWLKKLFIDTEEPHWDDPNYCYHCKEVHNPALICVNKLRAEEGI